MPTNKQRWTENGNSIVLNESIRALVKLVRNAYELVGGNDDQDHDVELYRIQCRGRRILLTLRYRPLEQRTPEMSRTTTWTQRRQQRILLQECNDKDHTTETETTNNAAGDYSTSTSQGTERRGERVVTVYSTSDTNDLTGNIRPGEGGGVLMEGRE
jgi:hypothetical protein